MPQRAAFEVEKLAPDPEIGGHALTIKDLKDGGKEAATCSGF